MHRPLRAPTRPEPEGLVIHGAARYDLLVWLYTLGGERKLRQKMLALARLKAGENVLDVGCGTGMLAILAKRKVGASGTVYGVDASPEMIARARMKANRAGVELILEEGAAQALPLKDGEVDVVLSTLMLHHVARKSRPQMAREAARVLKPGGRLLLVDFAKPQSKKRSFWDSLHRHGFSKLDEFAAELEAQGFSVIETGPVGEKNLQYVLASFGSASGAQSSVPETINVDAHDEQPTRSHRGAVLAMVGAGVAALVALHAGAGASAVELLSGPDANPLAYALMIAFALAVVVKIVFLAHRFGPTLVGGRNTPKNRLH